MNRFPKTHPPFVAGMLLTLFNVPLNAQSMSEDDLFELQLEALLNVKVSVASEFEETVLESGSTVELITRQQWENWGAENLTEAISHLPGTMTYELPWGGSAIAIRGYASNLSVRGIATLLDGMPMNFLRSGSALYAIRTFQTASLDRIEMIRGPGSARYGSDAFHGVLALSSYKSDENSTSFDSQLSSEGLKQISANHTSILDSGIAINASVSYVDQGSRDIPYTFTNPNTTQQQSSTRASSYDAYSGIFKIDIEHSEKFRTHYGIYFLGQDSEGSISLGQSQTPLGSIFLDSDISAAYLDYTAFNGGFTALYDHNISLEGKVFHWESDSDAFTDTVPLNGFGTLGKFEDKQTGVSYLLKQSKNDWDTQWVIGIDYKDAEISFSSVSQTVSGTDRTIVSEMIEPQSGFSREVTGLSFSANTTLFDEKLSLIYGGRHDRYTDFGNQTTPRFSIVYQPDSSSAIKLLYGEAFRAPISIELFGVGLNFKGNPNLKPELIETTELQYLFQKETWSLNLTYFQNDWTQGITLIPSLDPNFNSEYSNTGENEASGFEATFRGRSNSLSWDINGSWIESEAVINSGNIDYVAFPEQIYNLNLGYHFEASNLDLYLTNRIQRRAKEGPIIDNVPNPPDISNYYNTNLSLNWQVDNKTSLRFGIRNLFDRDSFLPSVWNNENGIETLGRYFQLSAKFKL